MHLLGNSLGGGTATRFALKYPKRVGRLVLMGPGGLQQNIFSPDPTEGIKRLFEFGGDPTRGADAGVHQHDGRATSRWSPTSCVEERFASATAPGSREAMASMGASFMNPDTYRGGHAVAGGVQDPPPHAAHLGP